MGLFDGYVDPQQFKDSGGLLGRLLSLQREQGQYQPNSGFDQAPFASRAPASVSWPDLSGGSPSFPDQTAAPNLDMQYQALRPILGDHKAMLATVHPDIGRALVARALADQQSRAPGNVVPASDKQPDASDASPDPIRPGSQYAQGALGLCAGGPPGCAAGLGLTAAQILGGIAVGGGLGALILKNREKVPAPIDKPANAPTNKSGNEPSFVPQTDQPANDGALVERSDKRNYCRDRWEAEYNSCDRFSRPKTSRFKEACQARANDRLHLCYQNGGVPDPDEPSEYSWKDVVRDRQRR